MQEIIQTKTLSRVKDYFALSKPGIIFGNLITAIAGFAMASTSSIGMNKLSFLVLGLTLVIGSACTFNNFIDQEIDAQMKRTQKRPLVVKSISSQSALLFGALCAFMGLYFLFYFVSLASMLAALFGFLSYVFVYSLSKYHSPLCTLLGSFAGAAPILVGYLAVSPKLDLQGSLVYLTIFFWQMPHFYAIAIFRLKDYAVANIPVLPAIKGMRSAKIEILAYTILYLIANQLIVYFGFKSTLYGYVMLSVTLGWLILALMGFKTTFDRKWARKMFFSSLLIVIVQSVMMVFS